MCTTFILFKQSEWWCIKIGCHQSPTFDGFAANGDKLESIGLKYVFLLYILHIFTYSNMCLLVYFVYIVTHTYFVAYFFICLYLVYVFARTCIVGVYFQLHIFYVYFHLHIFCVYFHVHTIYVYFQIYILCVYLQVLVL